MELNYRENILTPFQKEALQELFESYRELESFYLTGGTALAAFYLHHRYSEDLDLFTQGEFDSFKIDQVVADMTNRKKWKMLNLADQFMDKAKPALS